MVPLELTFHCWLAPPLHVQVCTLVPGVVPLPAASRHSWLLPLKTVSCKDEVRVQVWLAAPLHDQVCSWVPGVVLALGTSRHLPAATAWTAPLPPPLLEPPKADKAALKADLGW